jgi:hypothetical protein
MAETKTYQWIKGERAGDVVNHDTETYLEDSGNKYLIFTDGSQCNVDLLGDFIIEIASGEAEDLVFIEPAKVLQVIETPAIEKPAALNESAANISQIIQTVTSHKTMSPLESLLSVSKKSKEEININLSIEMPNIELLRVISSTIDDGENQVFDFLKNSWTESQMNDIKKQIGEFLIEKVLNKS